MKVIELLTKIANGEEFQLIIRLYYELDYRKFTINELSEIKEIVTKYKGQIESAKLVNVKEK